MRRWRGACDCRAGSQPIQPFEQANISVGAVTERFQGGLVGGALISGDGRLEAGEFDQNGPLGDTVLFGDNPAAGGQEFTPAASRAGIASAR